MFVCGSGLILDLGIKKDPILIDIDRDTVRNEWATKVNNWFQAYSEIHGNVLMQCKEGTVQVIANGFTVSIRNIEKDGKGFEGVLVSRTPNQELKALADRTKLLHPNHK